jgi:hypothetical protein
MPVFLFIKYKNAVCHSLREAAAVKRIFLVLIATLIVATLATTIFLNLYQTKANNGASEGSPELEELKKQYESLKEQYLQLQGNYTELQNKYDALQAASRDEAYNALRDRFDAYVAAYRNLRMQVNLRAFAWTMQPLITPSDPAVMSLVRNITGKVNVSDSTLNWNDINAMYNWVKDNIEYRADSLYPILPDNPSGLLQFKDLVVQLANETIQLRKGDCNDVAVLLCSMIRAYSPGFTVECIWITSKTSGHVAVQIPVAGHKVVILDPIRGYYSRDLLGNIAFNEVSGEITSWLSIWRPSMGNDVYVYRVFSDYMDKTFDTTADYVAWMYTR